MKGTGQELERVVGLDLKKPGAKFEVHSLRPARRVGPDGELLVDLVIEITQSKAGYIDPNVQEQVDNGSMNPAPQPDFIFRGGCSLLVDPPSLPIRYCIVKNILSQQRLAKQHAFLTDWSETSFRAPDFGS